MGKKTTRACRNFKEDFTERAERSTCAETSYMCTPVLCVTLDWQIQQSWYALYYFTTAMGALPGNLNYPHSQMRLTSEGPQDTDDEEKVGPRDTRLKVISLKTPLLDMRKHISPRKNSIGNRVGNIASIWEIAVLPITLNWSHVRYGKPTLTRDPEV